MSIKILQWLLKLINEFIKKKLSTEKKSWVLKKNVEYNKKIMCSKTS
jgi:hypothetical protein